MTVSRGTERIESVSIEYREKMLGVKTKRDRQFEILDARLIDIQGRLTKIRQSQHEQAGLDKDRFEALTNALAPIANLGFIKDELETIHRLVSELTSPPSQPKPLEVRFMFIVKDDHEAVNFSLKLGTVTDAEGNTIPDAQLDAVVESSDPSVVAVSFDSGSKTGSVSFGNPGVASITAQVKSGDTLLGSGAADFTVTVGDPAAISSVGLNFEGLTEA